MPSQSWVQCCQISPYGWMDDAHAGPIQIYSLEMRQVGTQGTITFFDKANDASHNNHQRSDSLSHNGPGCIAACLYSNRILSHPSTLNGTWIGLLAWSSFVSLNAPCFCLGSCYVLFLMDHGRNTRPCMLLLVWPMLHLPKQRQDVSQTGFNNPCFNLNVSLTTNNLRVVLLMLRSKSHFLGLLLLAKAC